MPSGVGSRSAGCRVGERDARPRRSARALVPSSSFAFAFSWREGRSGPLASARARVACRVGERGARPRRSARALVPSSSFAFAFSWREGWSGPPASARAPSGAGSGSGMHARGTRYPFTPSSDPEIRDAPSDARSWAQGAVRCRIQPFRVASGSLRRGQREADGDDSWSSTRGAERSVSERFGKALARIQRAVLRPDPTPVSACGTRPARWSHRARSRSRSRGEKVGQVPWRRERRPYAAARAPSWLRAGPSRGSGHAPTLTSQRTAGQ